MWFYGYEINLVWFILSFFSIYMVLSVLLEPFAPKILNDAFGYGKTTNENLNFLVKIIQVPKRHFTHFYVFAVIFMAILSFYTVKIVLLNFQIPDWLDQILNFFFQENRKASSIRPESILIVMTLLNLQVWRRLYECLYVNVDTGKVS